MRGLSLSPKLFILR